MSASADTDEYYDRVISTSSTSSSSSDARQIGYGIVPSSNNKNAAIVLFYPLSGCSLAISRAAASFRDYQCHVICVDRPDCGATSALLAPDDNNDDDSIDFAVHRIRGHANDVMEVLTHEGIEQVYLLGVCLGHPYALEVGRRLLDTQKLQICGLTLVAPFVSTASPHSWRVARLGAAVPSLVLYCCTESLLSVSSILTPMLLRPSMIERMVTPHEKETFGWTTDGSDDFSDLVDLILEMQSRTTNARGTEARLGVTPSWQRHVCDAFASGCGLIVDDESKVTTNQCQFPIRIHVSRKDKLAAIESVEWIADRCFGGRDVITIEEDIRSHELMTMFGGPPRNPILMHQIARNWGLLLEADKEE